MNQFKSLFAFTKNQLRGIFVLSILLIIAIGFYGYTKSTESSNQLSVSRIEGYQGQIDSLIALQKRKRDTIYPFNPNYITDYKGYKLGLTVEEIDRLLRFRESGKWINSTRQFKEVTGVSDKWLDSISPFFKFPKWVTEKKNQTRTYTDKRTHVRKNINQATNNDLRSVYGVGPATAKKIINERDRLGGFVDMLQVQSVYGLPDSTFIRIKEKFYLTNNASHTKIALNTATKEELLSIPYFNDYLVDALIEQRTLRDGFKSWDKVLLTSRFPEEKLDLIQLYLTLD